MIEVRVEEYCENCPDFEADVQKNVMYFDGEEKNADTTIYCEHKEKCKRLYRHIEDKNKRRNTWIMT